MSKAPADRVFRWFRADVDLGGDRHARPARRADAPGSAVSRVSRRVLPSTTITRLPRKTLVRSHIHLVDGVGGTWCGSLRIVASDGTRPLTLSCTMMPTGAPSAHWVIAANDRAPVGATVGATVGTVPTRWRTPPRLRGSPTVFNTSSNPTGISDPMEDCRPPRPGARPGRVSARRTGGDDNAGTATTFGTDRHGNRDRYRMRQRPPEKERRSRR